MLFRSYARSFASFLLTHSLQIQDCWCYSSSWPTPALPGAQFQQVSRGPAGATCAVTASGAIECAGNGCTASNYGQCNAPTTGNYTRVAAGEYSGCAIKIDGTLVCWCLPAASRGALRELHK